MSNIYAVVGPPGCGKTTYLARQTERAVEHYGNDQVLICSLTKAAAREAAGRVNLEDRFVGTLHAHCYRTLPGAKIIGREQIEAWNQEHAKLSLSPSTICDRYKDEDGDANNEGDELFRHADLLRSRRVDPSGWPQSVLNFHEQWQDFKAEVGAMDFTDLIERAITDLPYPPYGVAAILCDEYQDFSCLETELIRRWESHVETMARVGDGDQALFGFRGADPQALKVDTKPIVLSQSYRVPRAVHELAVRVISRSATAGGFEYRPTSEAGVVDRLPVRWRDPESVLDWIADTTGTCMVLGSCEYMLQPLISAMRDRGIPYDNPYADRWRPLRAARGKIRTADRLLAFLAKLEAQRPWTLAELKLWVPLLHAGSALQHGGKKLLDSAPDDLPTMERYRLLGRLFKPDKLEELDEPQLEWFVDHLTKDARKKLDYPLRVYRAAGARGLTEQPRVIPSTIHACKGGEADNVLVFPDLSLQGWEQYQQPGWYGEDAIWRQFYVAVTRSKRRLTLAEPVIHRRAVEL